MRTAMTIGGSDSCAGAGIQADLKTFSAYNIHGTTVITSVTAQNTLGVYEIFPVPAEVVESQLVSITEDVGLEAVKTGMLPTPEIVEVIFRCLNDHHVPNLVIDPVITSQSGYSLVSEEAVRMLKEVLMPICCLITPNIPEAEVLAGQPIHGLPEMEKAAATIHHLGARNVLIKGGHLKGESTGFDLLYSGDKGPIYMKPDRISNLNVHGTGCALSAAIAAGLAKGMTLRRAVEVAKDFTFESIEASYRAGHGALMVNPLQLSGDTGN